MDKILVETARIDVSVYKSHSTRAAASTAMKENLFPVEDIQPIDSARTTSGVIFSTTPTNVVPDGL